MFQKFGIMGDYFAEREASLLAKRDTVASKENPAKLPKLTGDASMSLDKNKTAMSSEFPACVTLN
jgi:hypothetical protein